ncbi:MAG: acyl carrier protein [Candidatus Doudnabacteria bacterium RIFCSPHIGHO2_02_FULL_46_11]|uniref:Acyl carrier protein n=1 Tax=Candidatus Doudnabacteria bacterium RIFCSPHIGHO2_02_FULL_46_11 TaxID=1817832 RepID=A0A1F5P512_9BACT|nr:MAG: acyl carrier protein [Candidatus Doudnabacteria bacterium RIFCSPHIGHO2_02_FULL_46_11]
MPQEQVVPELVRHTIASELGVDPGRVTFEAKLGEDLGADSLDMVQLVLIFEDTFDLEIPDEDAEKLVTVGDAVQYLRDKGVDLGE